MMLDEMVRARDGIACLLAGMEPKGLAFWAHLRCWELWDDAIRYKIEKGAVRA